MGHSGRRAARCLRPRQVPRRHPAHDGHTPPRRGPGADQGRRAPHEGPARRRRRGEPGRRAATGLRRGLLQHLALPPPRPHLPRTPAAAPGRLRGVPRRLLAQRPGGIGKVQVPQPGPHAGGGGRPRLPLRKIPGQLDKPQPQARPERRRLRAPGGPGQPRHGHALRRAHTPLQRGE